MTEMKARLVDKDGNPLGTAANPLKISGDVGGGVPDGGTTGQVLQKKTDADQDTEWGDGSGGGDVTGPASTTENNIPQWDSTTKKLKDGKAIGTTAGTLAAGDDSRFTNARTPTTHNLIDTTGHPVSGLTTGHFLKATGATTYAFGAHGLTAGDVGAATTSTKLDDFGTPDDNTDLNATTDRHGLLPKLGGGTTNFLRADGTWAAPTASGGGLTWNEVTGTTQAAAADNGYICNNAALVTVTLPSTCAVGKTIRIAGKGTGLWKIAQNAGQQIIFGNKNSTSGTPGYIAALYQYDSVELLCITADTVFSVTYAVGDLDVV